MEYRSRLQYNLWSYSVSDTVSVATERSHRCSRSTQICYSLHQSLGHHLNPRREKLSRVRQNRIYIIHDNHETEVVDWALRSIQIAKYLWHATKTPVKCTNMINCSPEITRASLGPTV